MKYPTTVSIVGNAFMAVAFLIMGPVPFIDLEPSVPLIQVNLNLFKLILYNNNNKKIIQDGKVEVKCSFSGWGQFLQSFCRSTSEFVISRVASPLVI